MLDIPEAVSQLDLKSELNLQGAVVGFVFPEAMSQLDLQSELGLQGALAEVDIAARSMKSSPVSCSSSPRSAETELVGRGGVGGA